MLSLGIVGLPNVGKSALFNALTSSHADADNRPFSTLEKNIGVVAVPDPRLDALAEIIKPRKVVPATVQFVDIAGLVRGSATGEGLGNKFLAHIRETDALVHVIRCFDDDDVLHVMETIDPARDREIVQLELALADLATVEKRLDRVRRAAKSHDKDAMAELGALEKAHAALSEGRWLSDPRSGLTAEELKQLSGLEPLTAKPVLYAANVADADLKAGGGTYAAHLRAAVVASGERAEVVVFSARIEAELGDLPPADRAAFLEELGVESTGLDRIIRAGFHLLGLQTYFTAGEKEVRAWTIRQGDTAPVAAGVIHSDFERGFIRAETVAYADFIRANGWKGARDQGLASAEGRDYVVADGDVILFRFNV